MSKTLKMLAIDLGASSGRGIVGKFDGNKISLEETHRFTNDPVNIHGALYWDMLKLFTEIKHAISNCLLSDNKDIKSISIDTWGVDFGLLDYQGQLIGNPYNYRDPRLTHELMNELFEIIPKEELYRITGTQFLNFNTIYQLYSFVKDPYKFANAKDMLFVPDLLKYFLTGTKQTEYTIASTSQLLDAKSRNWSWDIINKLGFPKDMFGEIVQPGTSAGKLLPHSPTRSAQPTPRSLPARRMTRLLPLSPFRPRTMISSIFPAAHGRSWARRFPNRLPVTLLTNTTLPTRAVPTARFVS